MGSSPVTPYIYTELQILANLSCLGIHLHICFFASNLGGRTFKAELFSLCVNILLAQYAGFEQYDL